MRTVTRGENRSQTAGRRGFAAFALAATALACAGPAANSASAVTPVLTSNGSIRDCVKTNLAGCVAWGSLTKGTSLTMHCYAQGSWATGEYRSDRWFYVTTSANKKGFVHSSRVDPQATVGKCSAHRGVAASRWASEHVGLYNVTSAERSALNTSITTWSGFCATFTYGAFKIGSAITPRYAGDAKPRYYAYKNAGRITSGGTPSVGSQVFYPNVTDFGHVAIYVGNGRIATTMGTGGNAKNARVSMSYFGTPAGWVTPDKV